MIFSLNDINFVAVLLGALVNVVFGMIWYTVFRTPWMRAASMTEARLKETGMKTSFTLAVIGALILSSSLAILLEVFDAGNMGEVATVGLLLWFAGVLPIHISRIAWEMRPWKLSFINGTFELVNILLVASAISFWN